MTDRRRHGPSLQGRLGRRAALALPLGLAGCGLFNDWFGEHKPPLPGKREPVMAERRGLHVDEGTPLRVALPPAAQNPDWPVAGGNPAHVMGHLATGEQPVRAWSSSIGSGGGYRDKILAQPVAANGVVYTMDSDAVVSAFSIADGGRLWRSDTKDADDDSTNVGGGLAIDGGTVYAVNGLAELVAFDASNGTERWRRNIGAPARSSPTVVGGRLFIVTLDRRLIAAATDDGHQLWSYQAPSTGAGVLGQPAPAFSDGLVVAGFGSGDMVGARAETGGVAWTESLAAARGRASLLDISAIRGLPAIDDGRVYAISLGGLLLALDLRSGRRLWEREVAGQDSVWVAGDWLFVISLQQQIAAIQRQEGRVAWVSDLPRYEDEEKQSDPIFWYGPVLAGGRLLAASTNGELASISPDTGEILGRQSISGAASMSPTVVDGTVFVVTDEGRLTAFR